MIEELGRRLMFSFSYSESVSSGIASITDNDDVTASGALRFFLYVSGGVTKIAQKNASGTVLQTNSISSGIDTFNVVMGDGNDFFVVDPTMDSVFGTAYYPYVSGQAGNDTITTLGGIDECHGGDGDDTISSGSSSDLLYGEAGDDSIDGGANSDDIDGGAGNDLLNGGSGTGNDRISGGVDNDTLIGGDGADTLTGADGDDVLYAYIIGNNNDGKADSLVGGAGTDTLNGTVGQDVLTQ
ncbi:MAG: calcium-binding protein [Tepidisphaeraceae bacterium]